jgi:hypothetical protein
MQTLDVTVETTLPCSAAAAWNYLVDGYFEHHARWDPAIVGMRRLDSGPLREGSRGVETRRFITRQDAEFEITALEPYRRFAFRNASGPFELEREYALESEADGTHLRFHFRMVPKGPMRPLFPLLRRTIARQVRENIGRIPRLLRQG